jgi:protein-tyrosine phosphatase
VQVEDEAVEEAVVQVRRILEDQLIAEGHVGYANDRSLRTPSRETWMRDIPLVDTFNLRDLGGYPTLDGRRVRWRRLFRGAGLHRLSGADLETVRALGIATAIDLRTDGEVKATGTYPVGPLPATFHHLPMIERIWDLDDLDADAAPHDYLLARYRDMLDEGAPTISAIMDILTRPDALPAAFYCAAGKDRTGVLAALVLDTLGVEPASIVADYHLSKERVERIRARALAASGVRASAMVAQPPAFMQAPAEAMELLLAWIREAHGSTPAYLASIGVAPATIDALRTALLE